LGGDGRIAVEIEVAAILARSNERALCAGLETVSRSEAIDKKEFVLPQIET
jgi:hypothetical protein